MLSKFLSQNGCTSGLTCIAAVALAPLLLCQCDDGSSARIKGLRDELQTLNHQIDDTQSQVSRLQSQIEASRAEKKKLEDDKAKAEEEREAASKALEQLKRDFETYKSHYKLSMRKRAPGFPLEDFVSTDGKAFKHVVLREITEDQVNFSHEGGLMKLHYKQLPETLQAVLGFLINFEETPRDVKAMTAKQINAQRRGTRDQQLLEVETKMKGLRAQREKSVRSLGDLRARISSAEAQDAPVLQLKREFEQLELYIKQIGNQILQVEIDLHRVRAEPVKLVPEK